MLSELQIRDFAIVDRLTLEFRPGFNVLTGETGAGKSIIIGALGAVLGARIGTDVIRTGQNTARIEAAFDLSGMDQAARTALDSLLSELGLDAEDDLLVLTREIQASGRSSARVGGRLTPVSTLQRIGETLVDIHSQTDNLSILRQAEQLNLLDRYAGVMDQRAKVAEAVAALRAIQRERAGLLADAREIARRVDLLEFQLQEIRSANVRPGEDDELANEQRVLGSAEKLTTLSAEAYEALTSARDSISDATAAARQIAAIDGTAAESAQAAEEVMDRIEDLLRGVRAYRDGVEFNPERLAEVEDRLELLAGLRRKYGPALPDVAAYAKQAEQELAAISTTAERREALQADEQKQWLALTALAVRLSALRAEAAGRLAGDVEAELQDLGLGRARFRVDLRQTPDPTGLVAGEGEAPVAFDDTGIDRVEFMLAANPGDPPKPLGRVASGGEMSRIMLALKSVLGRLDHVPTLVFDEVDVGIGGRTGVIVGQKLVGLAASHQVLCITHLPSVASFADLHLSVVKLSNTDRAGVQIVALSPDGRRSELANMLGGATKAAEQNAADLLTRAAEWKSGRT